MNQKTSLRWYRRVIVSGLLVCGFGCGNPAAMLWFLNKGDGKTPAAYKLEPLAGKKEVTVAVVVSSSPGLLLNSAENAGLDRELAHIIGNTLSAETKGTKVPINVTDSAKLSQMKMANPTLWETGSRSELAKKLGADYVVEVYVNSFVLDSKEFANELTVGRCALTVNVYRAGNDVEPVHSYPIDKKPDLGDTRSMNRTHYRQLFVKQLGEQIARQHINHIPDRERSMPQ